jgi:hypothetical protein
VWNSTGLLIFAAENLVPNFVPISDDSSRELAWASFTSLLAEVRQPKVDVIAPSTLGKEEKM